MTDPRPAVSLMTLAPPMPTLRARYILWDHDGVLVDTERSYYEATAEAAGRLGIQLDRERHLELQSRGIATWELAREAGIDEDAIAARRAERDVRDSMHRHRERLHAWARLHGRRVGAAIVA